MLKQINTFLSKYHFCYKIWNLETQTFLTMCFVKIRKGFDHNMMGNEKVWQSMCMNFGTIYYH